MDDWGQFCRLQKQLKGQDKLSGEKNESTATQIEAIPTSDVEIK